MKKSFIRSIEAVIAVLLFFSFYSISQSDYSTDSHSIYYNEIKSLIDSLGSSGMIDSYLEQDDLEGLKMLLSYYSSPLGNFKIEMKNIEKITAKNNNAFSMEANMSFLRLFEDSANPQSISIMDSNGDFLQSSIKSNYYKIELTAIAPQELRNAAVIFKNISLNAADDESINESAIHLAIMGKKAIIGIDSFDNSESQNNATTSIAAIIPYAAKDSIITAYLFYGINETYFIQDYSNFENPIELDYYSTPKIKSAASEVIFNDYLEAFEEKHYSLHYELNSDSQEQHIILEPSHEGIIVTAKDSHYGSQKHYNPADFEKSETIKSTIFLKSKASIINLKVQINE